MLNLFIGVLSAAFSAQSGSNLVTTLQRRWIRVLSLLDSFNPANSHNERPKAGVKFWKLRQKCWDIAENPRVDIIWTVNILVNVALLVFDHYPADDAWMIFADTINFWCLLLFTAEVFIKCMAYSLLGFLADGWGRMDMFVVLGSWGTKAFGVKAGVGVLRAFRTVRLVLLVLAVHLVSSVLVIPVSLYHAQHIHIALLIHPTVCYVLGADTPPTPLHNFKVLMIAPFVKQDFTVLMVS